MTRKDYIAIAADNPRFDYQRFYAACGLVQRGPGTYARSLHEHSSACDCQQAASETP